MIGSAFVVHFPGLGWISRCPFLALSMHQVAPNGCKARHKAKAKNHLTCRVRRADQQKQSNERQMAANGVVFRLSGGLLVRIQPEEPFIRVSSSLFSGF